MISWVYQISRFLKTHHKSHLLSFCFPKRSCSRDEEDRSWDGNNLLSPVFIAYFFSPIRLDVPVLILAQILSSLSTRHIHEAKSFEYTASFLTNNREPLKYEIVQIHPNP